MPRALFSDGGATRTLDGVDNRRCQVSDVTRSDCSQVKVVGPDVTKLASGISANYMPGDKWQVNGYSIANYDSSPAHLWSHTHPTPTGALAPNTVGPPPTATLIRPLQQKPKVCSCPSFHIANSAVQGRADGHFVSRRARTANPFPPPPRAHPPTSRAGTRVSC